MKGIKKDEEELRAIALDLKRKIFDFNTKHGHDKGFKVWERILEYICPRYEETCNELKWKGLK